MIREFWETAAETPFFLSCGLLIRNCGRKDRRLRKGNKTACERAVTRSV